jgi:hypothetical protein
MRVIDPGESLGFTIDVHAARRRTSGDPVPVYWMA